jgi:hypothetical protein
VWVKVIRVRDADEMVFVALYDFETPLLVDLADLLYKTLGIALNVCLKEHILIQYLFFFFLLFFFYYFIFYVLFIKHKF